MICLYKEFVRNLPSQIPCRLFLSYKINSYSLLPIKPTYRFNSHCAHYILYRSNVILNKLAFYPFRFPCCNFQQYNLKLYSQQGENIDSNFYIV